MIACRNQTARVALASSLTLAATCASAACGIHTEGVAFGAYDPWSRESIEGVGAIVVTCDGGDAYSLAISAGSGTYAARKMVGGRQSLAYNLYTDPAHAFVWGDGTGATSTAGGIGNGAATQFSIYGRIPAAQNVAVGHYVDNIVVTISF